MSQSTLTFNDIGLNDQLIEACTRLHWKCPTDIQVNTIPHALKGRNVIGLAETGSGKTAAFALPILQELMQSPKHYFALILAPTRELAAQVQAQFVALGNSIGLHTVLLVGGTPILEQSNQMAIKPPHILIATPGRFVDHLKRTKGFDEIKLSNLRFLVIDEADRMLGSDFESVIEKVGKLQRASLRDPVSISTRKSKFQTVASLRQYVHLVPQVDMESYLVYLLRSAFSPLPVSIEGLEAIKLSHDESELSKPGEELESRSESIGSAIVFTRTRDTSNRISLLLRQFLTTPVVTLNGDMPQAQRLGALAKFKRLPMSCLVATDVASRGLDIPHVGLVINYDVPLDAKTYMHRVGRTARAGRQGAALTLLTQFSVVFYLKEIEAHLMTVEGSTQEKVPALIPAGSVADRALEVAVGALQQEVKSAMALAGKTLEGLQRKPGRGQPRQAFVTVDDLKTPSTSEIALPVGTKRRTAWGSEAPADKKAKIAEVLAATSVQAGVAGVEEAVIRASKRMSSKGSKRATPTVPFKRAFVKRAFDKREEAFGRRGGGPRSSSTRGRGRGHGR